VAALGALPTDTEDERIRKASLTLAPLVIIPVATVWVIAYLVLGEPLGAAAPLAYQVISLISLFVFLRTKRYRFFRFSQLGLMLVLPFAFQIALGGFLPSSATRSGGEGWSP
jgi:adenylate cyclase